MNKECERTRKALPAYLRGHVFRTTRVRIDRHLQACVVCRSEFEALKSMEETRQLLKYIDSPEGVAHRVKEGVSALTKFKKLLYRPLWLAGIVLVAAGVTYYAMQPRQLDIEIENIVKTAPATTTSIPAAEPIREALVVTKPVASVQRPVTQPVSTAAVEPLAVSITPSNETISMQRINEVMSGHGELRKLKFSDTERRLSGTLTALELLTFFDRIGEVAKVRYDRKRFKSFPADQQVPFVLTLKAVPKTIEKPITGPHAVQSTQTHTSASTAAPSPLVTAPAASAAR
ncbi:MAG: zf-HC2 domain-containing protein [Nitrospirae bacterium]|nr:zf-HC2 domain-containing protein [Nitrospirota bacterium]